MSVETQTQPADVETTDVTPDVQPAPEPKPEPTLPTVPDTDDDLRQRAQYVTRLTDLLTIANADAENREALDTRAFAVAARAMTVNPGRDALKHETVLMHHRDDIDPETGKGRSQKFHYPRERSALLMGIAEQLGVAALLTHRTYAYSGSRRQYSVQLWGIENDVKRVMTFAKLLDERVLAEIAKIDFPTSTTPAQQTVAKRNYVRDFTTSVGERLSKLTDALDERAQGSISDRKTAADKAREEWVAEEEAAKTAA